MAFWRPEGIGAVLSPPVHGSSSVSHCRIPEDLLPGRHHDGLPFQPASITGSIFLMVELDAKKVRNENGARWKQAYDLKSLTCTYGYPLHLTSRVGAHDWLVGFTPPMAVFFAIVTCFLTCFYPQGDVVHADKAGPGPDVRNSRTCWMLRRCAPARALLWAW